MRIRLLVLCVSILSICYSVQGFAKSSNVSAICDHYAKLLSSDFWAGESQKRAKAFLRDHIDPLASEVRLLRSLAATRSFTVGLSDGALSLLELSRAYDTVGCATASMILTKVETQAGKPAVSQMLRDFDIEIRKGKAPDKPAKKLLKALTAYAKAIEDFKFQQGVSDFSAKETGERMMQTATAAHKAKGTLRYITLSASQFVSAVHVDYLVKKGLASPVQVKSCPPQKAPATVRAQVSTRRATYVCVDVTAADQWDTISFEVRANNRPIQVAIANLKGSKRVSVIFPITTRTSVELKVFNGANCKNTNWLQNSFTATISYLRRTKEF